MARLTDRICCKAYKGVYEGMKTIEIKEGNKTTYKIVPDNYEPTDDRVEPDMTTSGRRSISMGVDKKRWDEIFKKTS
jgi:hypothetical protein